MASSTKSLVSKKKTPGPNRGARYAPRFSQKAVLGAIDGSGGVVRRVALRLGVTWSAAKKYIEMYPAAAEAFQNEREGLLDAAEEAMHNLIAEGDPGMVRFFLSTIGRKRGFCQTTEVTGPALQSGGHAPIKIEIINRADQVDKDARPDE